MFTPFVLYILGLVTLSTLCYYVMVQWDKRN